MGKPKTKAPKRPSRKRTTPRSRVKRPNLIPYDKGEDFEEEESPDRIPVEDLKYLL